MRKSPYGTKIPKYKRWTAEEDKILMENYLTGHSYMKLMRLTGRNTYGGIGRRLNILKLRSGMKRNVSIGGVPLGAGEMKIEKRTHALLREGLTSSEL